MAIQEKNSVKLKIKQHDQVELKDEDQNESAI